MKYHARYLKLVAHDKPLDFGAGGLTGSINREGRIVSINAYHPEYGYITVSSTPPFDEAQRYSPPAVRAYRRSLAGATGFGLRLDGLPIVEREYALLEDAIPRLRFRFEGGETLEITVFAALYQNVPHVFCMSHSSADLGTVPFEGRVWIQRCAYSQLTEGGPLPMPPVTTRILETSSDGATLVNQALNTRLTTNIHALDDDNFVQFDAQVNLNGTTLIVFRLSIGDEPTDSPLPSADIAESMLNECLAHWKQAWQGWTHENHPLDLPLRRALVYAQQCCVPIDEEALCVITDHQLLPLSWTRDAYYTIMPLMHWRAEFADNIRRHLIWLFGRAQRPEGYWGRAYLANGKVKDPAMQLDQQLYPLLELAEYTQFTGDKTLWRRLEGAVHHVLDMLLSLRHDDTGLFPTRETPADDPVHLPFHLSSHILFWHTLQKLSQLADAEWKTLADEIKQAIDRQFVTDWRGKPIYAYLTDGEGNFHLYHDANDLPLALAPLWGFCPADDATWRNTMDFSFTADNTGGYYGRADDPYPGLGSVHTPDTWHLGSVQELLYAQITGDETRQRQVIQKIVATMQWDGALSEAFSATTGEVVSRHWFAWPNAALHLCQWR